MSKPSVHFVVVRANWRQTRWRWYRMPGHLRLASYETVGEAEADRAGREADAQRRLNPFHFGASLVDLTTYPEGIFLDWVRDAGVTPPEPGSVTSVWATWWDSLPETSLARLSIWNGLDKVRFYGIVERPPAAVGYALVPPAWHYNDEYDCLNDEGGKIQAVYRTRERALEEARKLNQDSEGHPDDWFPSGIDPLDHDACRQRLVEGLGVCDIVEIELEGLS